MILFIDSQKADLLKDLTAKKALDAELEGRIKKALDEFKSQFSA